MHRRQDVEPLGRDREAQRAEDAGVRRHNDARHAERIGERATEQRSRAAERQQRHAARIDAARHTHALQGARHDRRRHLHDAGRDLADIARQLQPRHGAFGGRTVELHGIGQWVRRIEPAQRETGVGHGWLGAAAPIARGPRLGSGAPRTDSKRAPLVDSRDTAAARADRLDQNRGKRDGHTGNRFGALGDGDATSD